MNSPFHAMLRITSMMPMPMIMCSACSPVMHEVEREEDLRLARDRACSPSNVEQSGTRETTGPGARELVAVYSKPLITEEDDAEHHRGRKEPHESAFRLPVCAAVHGQRHRQAAGDQDDGVDRRRA